jgi:hypothetical protein
MPRASAYFKLGLSQPQLDFVDIDVIGDTPVYVDPLGLRPLAGEWAKDCVGLLQSFFGAVIEAIRRGTVDDAAALLGQLSEPNETHLGLSQGAAAGRGVGIRRGHDLADALAKSEAIESGLLSDLEDTILMVEGVSFDLVSDMTTNIIREPLIRYTQAVCHQFGIPLASGIFVGHIWDPGSNSWLTDYHAVPLAKNRPLLFVPKVIARRRLQYNQDEYLRHYLLPYLADEEIQAKTSLVKTVKGEPRVFNKDLIAKYGKKYGRGKGLIVQLTREHPEVLKKYKEAKRAVAQDAMEHEDLARLTRGKPPDWDALLRAVTEVATGDQGAAPYHKAVAGLMTALFYPTLTNPETEYHLHGGRKRVDIAFVNEARDGFFRWIATHYKAAHVFVECKNYEGDPGNPELDQLTGRFSPGRGQVGILACRRFKDKELFIMRCRDSADDQHGYVIPLDDADLARLVDAAKRSDERKQFALLKERFDRLIS